MKKKLLCHIDVTPLVDVSLTTLIIFILIAPMIEHGIKLDLPVSSASKIEMTESLTVSISHNGDVYLDSRVVTLRELEAILIGIQGKSPETIVVIRGDAKVPYGKIIEVIDIVKNCGLEHVGMSTREKL